MTIRELARRADLSWSLISQYEGGGQNPTYGSACALAEGLEIPVCYLWDHLPPPELGYEPNSGVRGEAGQGGV